MFIYRQLVFIFLTYLMNKLRRLKIYLLQGEKLLSTEMEIISTELLLSERMKQAMKNMRKSLVQVIVCLRKIQRSLSCNFSSQTPRRILSRKARSRELRQKGLAGVFAPKYDHMGHHIFVSSRLCFENRTEQCL